MIVEHDQVRDNSSPFRRPVFYLNSVDSHYNIVHVRAAGLDLISSLMKVLLKSQVVTHTVIGRWRH